MNKHAVIAGISVVLLLIILPLVSFYYLRQGLSFRVDALEALEQNETEVRLTKELPKVLTIEKGMVNVLIKRDDFDSSAIDDLHKKFQKNKYFCIHTFYEVGVPELSAIIDKNYMQSKITKEQKAIFDSGEIILIDTSGLVRATYSDDESDFKEFIRHLSVLLPMEQSRKIVLER